MQNCFVISVANFSPPRPTTTATIMVNTTVPVTTVPVTTVPVTIPVTIAIGFGGIAAV